MARTIIEELLLFVLPFLAFAGYLVVRRRNPFDVEHWQGRVFWLSVAGLVLGIAGLIAAGVMAERHTGSYDPPHVEGGRLVPGRFDDKR
jgi:purine-cytosine permease-like protein